MVKILKKDKAELLHAQSLHSLYVWAFLITSASRLPPYGLPDEWLQLKLQEWEEMLHRFKEETYDKGQ